MKVYVKNILRKCLKKLDKKAIFAFILAFPFVIYAFVELCFRINFRINYELSGVYTWDTTIYWAVGRGIVNGISPWSELFETKPPGIFLLSAISYKIFDSPVFTNYFQVFVLVLIAVIPIVSYFLLSNYRSVSKMAFACLAGLLLALYSAERSGEVQVESFGAAFACIAVFAMAAFNFEKRKILYISLASIGILGACGFKEPFLFPLFGISLILCKDVKNWFYSFFLPLIIAICLGTIILLLFGWLDDFLQYLGFMSSTHISRYGSPFRRAMDFTRLYNDLNAFSWGLAIALFVILSLPFLKFINSIRKENDIFIKVALFGIAFFLSAYSVGLGGEFFNHHFIFALPFYMALILILLKNWNEKNSAVAKLGLISFIFFAVATLNLPNLNFNKRAQNLNNWSKEPKQAAVFLDSIMYELNIDKYAFIGLNGPEIYGWTKHSPSGPYFLLYDWCFNNIPNFRDSIISNVYNADIVVVSKIPTQIADKVNLILNEHFTMQQVNRYRIYFHKKEEK